MARVVQSLSVFVICCFLINAFAAESVWAQEPSSAEEGETGGKPDDPFLQRQTYIPQVQADAGWTAANGSENVTVAIIDTGVDLDHPDLAANIVEGINLLQPAKKPEDDSGHGTRVAGVIGAPWETTEKGSRACFGRRN